MAGSYLLALATAVVVAILVVTSADPVAATAAATNKYSGRMVIIRAPGARVLADVSAGGAAVNKWQQRRRRRRLVEDEVAPEFGGLQLGAGNGGGSVGDSALDKDRANCLPSGECAKPGGSYTRGCTYAEKCSH